MEYKYSRPTYLSRAPRKTVWFADMEDGVEIFVQASEDESKPQWLRAGKFLENAFCFEMQNPDFITTAMKLYDHHKNLN